MRRTSSSLQKLGLSRTEAASFFGVTLTAFDALVSAGDAPPARRVGTVDRWDRRELEEAFSALPYATTVRKLSPYSDVA